MFISTELCQSWFLHLKTVEQRKMSETLCLQWNDYKENAINAFGSLREDKDFTDVTLVCEDGRQLEVHKVVLAISSKSSVGQHSEKAKAFHAFDIF